MDEYMDVGLIIPKRPSQKLLSWLKDALGGVEHQTSAQARVGEFEICHKGDLVAIASHLHSWTIAKVLFFAKSGGVCFAAVTPYQSVAKEKSHSIWRQLADPTVVFLSDIMCSVMHSQSNAAEARVLHNLSMVG